MIDFNVEEWDWDWESLNAELCGLAAVEIPDDAPNEGDDEEYDPLAWDIHRDYYDIIFS